jgi:transposase InsO family protein
MELWQLDVMGGIWLTNGRELKAVTGIDDHSRFWVMAGLVERANTGSVCRVFTQALERYGTPEEVLTDNGKVFTGRLGPHPAEVLFDRICREQGISHRLTGIRAPTTTGKIERFHKTLRAELLTGRRFESLALAQQVLDAWVVDYNTQRPHQPSPWPSRPCASSHQPPRRPRTRSRRPPPASRSPSARPRSPAESRPVA